MRGLVSRARHCLGEGEVDAKLACTADTAAAWVNGELVLDASADSEPVCEAGYPGRLRLVHPRGLVRRSLATPKGRAAMIHSIAHIEFSAINLAWDAVCRFRGLPRDYYDDWVRVAKEEAEHFGLLRERLRRLGAEYGDFPAHNGLWDMALRTAHDPLARMALVPRGMEARGLDVTPGIMQRFEAAGDTQTVAALAVILRDEVGHVAIGTRWFHYLCEQRALDPEDTYFALLNEYLDGEIRGSLHREARRQAGFSDSELARLEALRA